MEITLNVTGQVTIVSADLVKAAELFAGAMANNTIVHNSEPSQTIEACVTSSNLTIGNQESTRQPETPPAPPKPVKHLHYGQQSDNTTYAKWDEMANALDNSDQATVKETLAIFSENGTYGGVQPANWDKVIQLCKVGVQVVPAQTEVPTSAVTYSIDDLASAASTLMDAGRQNDLIALLGQFGVESLPALGHEQYGAFATALRGMGAKI